MIKFSKYIVFQKTKLTLQITRYLIISVIERLIGTLVKVLISSYWEIVRFIKNFNNEKNPTYIALFSFYWVWANI